MTRGAPQDWHEQPGHLVVIRAFRVAAAEGSPCRPRHLLAAAAEQDGAGIDKAAVRRAALAELGEPQELPPIAMPELTPAGTLDRPALPTEQLDQRAWSLLAWRQDHLPLGRVRRIGQAEALSALEQRAAWRVADHLRLDDDQRYSLLSRHGEEVDRRIAAALPAYADRDRAARAHAISRLEKMRRRRRLPSFMVGWPTWFANRRVGIRNRWFALTVRSTYRHQPLVSDDTGP